MPKIFISYRRQDSEAITGRIYDRLVNEFGADNVFQDVENILPGTNFRTYLRDQIANCDVVMVIIGQQWVSIRDAAGNRRLDNSGDFVRIEVENGLNQSKLVIPVLVNGADVPIQSSLPSSMQGLCDLNAATVRHNPDFDRDIGKLIDGIRLQLGGGIKLKTTVPLPDILKILPAPFEWCVIPQGNVKIEYGSWREDRYITSETPSSSFYVPSFAIAKYPITNGQYKAFLNTNDGYIDPQWWDFTGITLHWHKSDTKHVESDFIDDKLPAKNIAWYDAIAFCRWLGHKIRDNKITLPTDRQWQRAAQGDEGFNFPWGNEWNSNNCNNSVTNSSEGVSDVEKYQNGVSPFGVLDMVGNIQEWSLTTSLSRSNLLSDGNSKLLFGGCWKSTNTDSFLSKAEDDKEIYRAPTDDCVGFRIVYSFF